MDFAKFVAMVSTGSLYFARMDQFGDPHEGAISRQEYERKREMTRKCVEAGEVLLGHHMGSTELARAQMFLNCWCMQEHESDALWRIYGAEHGGLAVRSTYSRLAATLTPEDDVGEVTYIDYDNETFPDDNVMNCTMHKRRVFSYEREIRAVRWLRPPQLDAPQEIKDRWNRTIHIIEGTTIIGIRVPVILDDLISEVVMSPYSPDWFGECIAATIRSFNCSFPVVDSAMRAAPLAAGYPYTEKAKQQLAEAMKHAKPVKHIEEINVARVARPQSSKRLSNK